MRNIPGYVLSFLAGFVVTFGVGTVVLKSMDDKPTEKPAVVKTVQVTPTPTPTVTESPVAEETPGTLDYGDTFQYPEGIRVTVSAPKDYPKDPTVKMNHKYYKLFTIKVKNVSGVMLRNVEDWFVYSDDGEFTNTEGNGMPGGNLGVGQTLTITVVFGYDSISKISLSFATCPDIQYLCEPHTWS